MKLELLKRVAVFAAVLATSAPSQALAADTNQACSRLLPKGADLPAAPAEAIAVPVRASALVTGAQFAVAELRTGDGRSGGGARLLAFSDQGAAPKVFVEFRAAGEPHAVLAWRVPAQDVAAEGALRRLAVFERLYAFVLRGPPLTSYDVEGPGGASKARALSQPDLLASLARLRNCAARDLAQAGGQGLVNAWEMPVLTRPAASGKGGARRLRPGDLPGGGWAFGQPHGRAGIVHGVQRAGRSQRWGRVHLLRQPWPCRR